MIKVCSMTDICYFDFISYKIIYMTTLTDYERLGRRDFTSRITFAD